MKTEKKQKFAKKLSNKIFKKFDAERGFIALSMPAGVFVKVKNGNDKFMVLLMQAKKEIWDEAWELAENGKIKDNVLINADTFDNVKQIKKCSKLTEMLNEKDLKKINALVYMIEPKDKNGGIELAMIGEYDVVVMMFAKLLKRVPKMERHYKMMLDYIEWKKEKGLK